MEVKNGVAWSEADSSCAASGWSLAKVETNNEQEFLSNAPLMLREQWIAGKEVMNWIWEHSK